MARPYSPPRKGDPKEGAKPGGGEGGSGSDPKQPYQSNRRNMEEEIRV